MQAFREHFFSRGYTEVFQINFSKKFLDVYLKLYLLLGNPSVHGPNSMWRWQYPFQVRFLWRTSLPHPIISALSRNLPTKFGRRLLYGWVVSRWKESNSSSPCWVIWCLIIFYKYFWKLEKSLKLLEYAETEPLIQSDFIINFWFLYSLWSFSFLHIWKILVAYEEKNDNFFWT